MSENKKKDKDRSEYQYCRVETWPTEDVLEACKKNGDCWDIMVDEPKKSPPIGKKEDCSVITTAIAEINIIDRTLRSIDGEKGAAQGIKRAPTTEEVKAAKVAAKAKQAEDERRTRKENDGLDLRFIK